MTQSATPVLELENVSKQYGDFHAVQGMQLRLDRGEVCGFLGPNGAGKTTTLRMILGIIQPSEGRISVFGGASVMAVRHRIGYLPEEKGLYKKMKAWSVIAYFATLKGVSHREAKQRAYALLDRYGLKDFAEHKTEALSKGMGQKVQVLASIAHEPEFIILDEPFSGLDPVNQGVLEEIVADLKARGRTILFSTHVMQHAERLCDRVVVVAKGRKVFDGTMDEARRTQPRRIRIRTSDAVEALRNSGVVSGWRELGGGEYEMETQGAAGVQPVLDVCFQNGIRLSDFDAPAPSLHDVFVKLVGPDAREAVRR